MRHVEIENQKCSYYIIDVTCKTYLTGLILLFFFSQEDNIEWESHIGLLIIDIHISTISPLLKKLHAIEMNLLYSLENC